MDNRPILITGSLSDFREQAGQSVLTLSSHICRDAQLRVELVTNADEARVVLAQRSESPSYYAATAQIASVEKAEAGTENGGSVFIARGQCSNLLFTGFDGFSIDVEESLAKPHR
jgi:hypothetical protein